MAGVHVAKHVYLQPRVQRQHAQAAHGGIAVAHLHAAQHQPVPQAAAQGAQQRQGLRVGDYGAAGQHSGLPLGQQLHHTPLQRAAEKGQVLIPAGLQRLHHSPGQPADPRLHRGQRFPWKCSVQPRQQVFTHRPLHRGGRGGGSGLVRPMGEHHRRHPVQVDPGIGPPHPLAGMAQRRPGVGGAPVHVVQPQEQLRLGRVHLHDDAPGHGAHELGHAHAGGGDEPALAVQAQGLHHRHIGHAETAGGKQPGHPGHGRLHVVKLPPVGPFPHLSGHREGGAAGQNPRPGQGVLHLRGELGGGDELDAPDISRPPPLRQGQQHGLGVPGGGVPTGGYHGPLRDESGRVLG